MRDRETIDTELRLLRAVHKVAREHDAVPSMERVDALLETGTIP